MTIIVRLLQACQALFKRVAPHAKPKTGLQCRNCGLKFHETDQTRSEYEAGQCPACHSERIKEV